MRIGTNFNIRLCGVDPVTGAIASAVIGSVLSSAMAPDTPELKAPEKPKAPDLQAAQTADAQTVRANANNGGPGDGTGSSATAGGTLLTGSAGVDPTTLNLKKNVLLGGTS